MYKYRYNAPFCDSNKTEIKNKEKENTQQECVRMGKLHCAPFLCRKRVEEEEMGV